MSHELGQPADDMDASRPVVDHHPVGAEKVVGICGTANKSRGNEGAGDGLEEDVEYGVDEAAYGADVGGEVFISEDFRQLEERGAVRGLCN